MPLDALSILRRVNCNLRSALIRLRPERTRCSTLQPEDFSELLSQVFLATECVRNIHSRSAPTTILKHRIGKEVIEQEVIEQEVPEKDLLETEALEYRGHLEDLKRFLPDLHVRLLAERARLETARSHLAAASAWAGARKETL